MQQETQISYTSLAMDHQSLYITPSKKDKSYSDTTDELLQTPKGKLSKSQVVEKLLKNKVVIDYNMDNDYSIDDIDTSVYVKETYDTLSSPKASSCSSSGQSTARRFETTPINTKKPFTFDIKESNEDQCEVTPFCRLLDASDNSPISGYQALLAENEEDECYDAICEKYSEQIQLLDSFFRYFNERTPGITGLFTENCEFKIDGGYQMCSLSQTLNALATIFLRFECEECVEFDDEFASSGVDEDIIITTTGKLTTKGFSPNFALTARISLEENLISQIKLKLC